MPDREKVIKGLECCRDLDISDMKCPDECPYHVISNECGCCLYVPLLNDAIALLREMEPRVLTLEEAKTYEVVWPEDKGEGELHPLIVQNNMNDSKYYKYGIHWRVWSAKPTDEQRKAVKWGD